MGTAAVIEIDSDDEKEAPFAVLQPPPADDPLDWVSGILLDDDELDGFGEGLLDDSVGIQDFLATLEGEKKSACAAAAAADVDDDCVILDGDPDKALVVVVPKEEKKPGGSEDELQVLGEKGEVACRDFPHPRHLCFKLPFINGSHANHCTMCHCYVCDSPAPCPRWGKGSLPTDHCHATDKDGKWNKQRQLLKRKSLAPSNHGSVKKMSLSSTTTSSSQQYAVRQVSVPQPFAPLGITLNQASAERVPVASNLQNQQLHPSVRAAQNVVRAVHPPKAPAPGTKTPGKLSKRPAAAPTVSATSNGYSLNRAVPNDVPWRPGPSHLLQTGQAALGCHGLPGRNGAPGSNGRHGMNGAQGRDGTPGQPGLPGRTVTVIHGFPTQRSLAGPVQVCPTAHLQVAENRVAQLLAAQNRVAHRQAAQNGVSQLQAAQNKMALAQLQVQAAQNRVAQLQASENRAPATGLQASQYAARTAQGTRRSQDPLAIQKPWQVALANLAADLGVSDYNINPPPVQQPVSTQSLQQSQLLTQTKASQGGETHRGNTPTTVQMRPGLRQLNHKSGDGLVAASKTQGQLNSHISLVPSETYLNSLVAAKPATKQ